MSGARIARFCAGLLAAAALTSAQLLSPASAAAEPRPFAAAVLYYDASRAAEFRAAVDTGASNWNSRVTNVILRPAPAGTRPNITVYASNGWPYAVTTSLGNGRFYMGRQAVNQGHYSPRIAAHELGHLLGLPDRRTGLCGDLMSGSSAPASCRNDFPNAAEAAEVNQNFDDRRTASARFTAAWQAPDCFY